MQLTTKLRNKSTPHSLLLRPRVGDVVLSDGAYYQNTSGINSVVTEATNWFKIFSAPSSSTPTIIIDKVAGNIVGNDPDFSISLAGDNVPAFPASISVYVDLNGTANYILQSPTIYNPVTKALSGMNSPTDFPNQKIRIAVL